MIDSSKTTRKVRTEDLFRTVTEDFFRGLQNDSLQITGPLNTIATGQLTVGQRPIMEASLIARNLDRTNAEKLLNSLRDKTSRTALGTLLQMATASVLSGETKSTESAKWHIEGSGMFTYAHTNDTFEITQEMSKSSPILWRIYCGPKVQS